MRWEIQPIRIGHPGSKPSLLTEHTPWRWLGDSQAETGVSGRQAGEASVFKEPHSQVETDVRYIITHIRKKRFKSW